MRVHDLLSLRLNEIRGAHAHNSDRFEIVWLLIESVRQWHYVVHITKAFSFSLITSSSIASFYLLKLICAPCHQQWVTIAQTLCVIHQISKFLLQYDHKLCKYGLNCGQSQLRVYTEQFGAFNLFNRPFVCSVIYSFCSHRSCDCLLARAITRCYRSFVCIAWLKTNIARLDSEAHLNGIQQQKLHRSERIAKCYL